MTFEINFKEDGDILYGADIMENLSFPMNCLLSYAIDSVATTNQPNIIKNTSFSTSSNAIITGISSGDVVFCFVFDDFEDNSIDGNKWSTALTGSGGEVVEEGTNLTCQQNTPSVSSTWTASAISDGASGLDFKSFSGNSECIVRIALSDGASPGNAKLQISDGSTHVDVATETVAGVFNLVFNKSGEEVRVWDDGVEVGSSPFSLAGLGANWYLRIYADKTTTQSDAGGSASLLYVGYIDGTTGTGQVTTGSTTLGKASTNAVCRFTSSESDETSFTVKVSANGGSNFTTLTMDSTYGGMGEITDGLTSGTSAQMRFEMAIPTVITTTAITLKEYDLDWAAYFG